MESSGRKFADQWISIFKSVPLGPYPYNPESINRKLLALLPLLDEKVFTFTSPAVHKPYTDILFIQKLLSNVISIIEDLQYEEDSVLISPQNSEGICTVGLLFRGRVRSENAQGKIQFLTAEGIDLFKVNNDGKAVALKVMLRPLKTLGAVAEQMMAKL